jgi:hypothetical protein
MNKREILRDKLLRADGIDPSVIPEAEMTRLRQLLDGTKSVAFPWRKAMKTPIAKFAVAAGVVLAVLIGMYFLGGTSSTTWAAVLNKVKDFDTCVSRSRDVDTTGPRPDGFEFASEGAATIYYSEQYGRFSEGHKNGQLFSRSYTLLQDNEFVFICYPLKVYKRAPLTEAQVREFHEKNPKQIIAKILEHDYVELGDSTMEGKRVRGIELRDPNAFSDDQSPPPPLDDFSARFWIDAQTQLPVWMEISFVPKGSQMRHTGVWDQFQWGVVLDPNLFKPAIPADFEADAMGDGPRPDSTPKTQSAEAFAANTQAEPYLRDFDHLKLPDLSKLVLLGVDVNVPRDNVRLLSHSQIWELQDKVMATWPSFEQVQAQLRLELQDKLGIEQLSVDELVATGIALRERFWELTGCFSETSYPYAYAARIVTEMAHAKAPENLAVTDQLVESISTYAVGRTWHEDENQRVPNPTYPGLLTDLRLAQFEQIKSQAAQGRTPTWKDFVRVHDLAIVLSSYREDYAQAAAVAQWLIAQAPTAGWTYYLDSLKSMEQAYSKGEGYRTGLFMHGGDVFPAEYQYARRLFSFQGPRQRAETLLPIHLRHLKGW